MLLRALPNNCCKCHPCADVNLAEIEENRLQRMLRNREAVSLFGWSPYLNDPKLQQRLHRISVPTVVIWGMDDELIPSRYGEEYARALPNARLETIDNCGHRICIDQPDQIVELIASVFFEYANNGGGSCASGSLANRRTRRRGPARSMGVTLASRHCNPVQAGAAAQPVPRRVHAGR